VSFRLPGLCILYLTPKFITLVDFQLDAQISYLCLYNTFIKKGGTLLVAQLVEVLRYKPEGSGFDS